MLGDAEMKLKEELINKLIFENKRTDTHWLVFMKVGDLE